VVLPLLSCAPEIRKTPRENVRLRSPWDRRIYALVFVRSFQETEKNQHDTVAAALAAEDSEWFARGLVIIPSHLEVGDVRQMISIAHEHGFHAVGASLLLNDQERERYRGCWAEDWDVRWNIPNPAVENGWEAQVEALGAIFLTVSAVVLAEVRGIVVGGHPSRHQ
jgi:hypothetical protein